MTTIFLGGDLNGFLRRVSMYLSLLMFGVMWYMFGHNREWVPVSPEQFAYLQTYSTRVILAYIGLQGLLLLITSMDAKGYMEVLVDFVSSLFPLVYGVYRGILHARGVEVLNPDLASMLWDWTLAAGIDAMYDLGIAFIAATRRLQTT